MGFSPWGRKDLETTKRLDTYIYSVNDLIYFRPTQECEIKLPTSVGSSKKQENFKKKRLLLFH